jgi:hypothetical protein
MKAILNGALTLDEYLASQAYGKKETEKVTLTVSCNEAIERDGFKRLRTTVDNLNKNIGRCSLEILDKDGTWKDLMSKEEMEGIHVPLPEGLSNIEKLTRIEAYASQKKEEMGGLSYDVAELTRDYNLI